MSESGIVARNAAWLTGATTLTKVIAFASFAIVARLAGPEVTGTFFYGVSVTSVFVILADLGMTPVVIRAVAGKREDAGRIVSAALRMKLFLAPVAILGALAYGIVSHSSPLALATIGIACFVMTADTMHLLFYGVLRGTQDTRPEAIGMFVGQCVTALISILVALFRLGPVGLAIGLLAGSVWNVGWSLRCMRGKSFHLPVFSGWGSVRILLIEASPFAIAGIAVKLYSYFDSLLINIFHGASAVGAYAVAYKMTYALQFLPLTITAAVYPALSAAWAAKDHDRVKRMFGSAVRFMALFGFAASASLSALAPRLIPFVYGKSYDASVDPFVILPWVLLPIFLDFPVGSLLNGSHRAHLKTTAQVVTMVINLACNALLVPRLGGVGAAWSAVVSFWTLFFIGVFLLRKDEGVVPEILSAFVRGIGAAVLLWVAIRLALPFGLFSGLAVAGVAAIAIALGAKLLLQDDVYFAVVQVKRRLGRGQADDIHES